MTVTAHVALAVADATAGVTAAACGVLARRRRPASRVGLVMLGTSVCWFAGDLVAPLAYLHRGPLIHLTLGYPTGKLHRALSLITVSVAYVASAVETLARDPWITLGLALLLLVAAVDNFARTAGPPRKAAVPALVVALALAGVLVLSDVNVVLGWRADLALALAYDAVVAALTVVLTTDLLRGRWTDSALADLVTGLGAEPRGYGVRSELRRALGDPSLEVGYWVPDRRRYVDEAGRPLDVSAPLAGRVVTRIDDDDDPLAVLVHDAGLLGEPSLLAGAVAAARLAVDNARMNAAIRAHVSELNASRRRIVQAGDAQRRRLEHELARGAQARLEEAAALLRTPRPERRPAELDHLVTELEGARAELRELAHGIRPRALTSGGLAEALPILASRSPVPVSVRVHAARHHPAIESAAYFVCSEALTNAAKHAGADRIEVEVTCIEGLVEVSITDDGTGGADPRGSGMRGLTDRVQALGGTLTVRPADGKGTTIVVRLPSDPGQAGDLS
jgi:signal transduction histidine kinase